MIPLAGRMDWSVAQYWFWYMIEICYLSHLLPGSPDGGPLSDLFSSQEQANKILLTLASDFGCLVDAGMAVRVGDRRFLNLKQSHFHRSLGRKVVIAPVPADQIALLPHPAE